MGVFASFVALVALVPAVVLVVAGLRVLRSASTAHRVPVEAVVVDYTNFTNPSRVTFDYPVPGGWSRATRVEGFSSIPRQGWLVHPGQRFVVWVDPHRPQDVALSAAGSARGVLGPAMVVGGAAWGLFGLMVLATVLRLGLNAG